MAGQKSHKWTMQKFDRAKHDGGEQKRISRLPLRKEVKYILGDRVVYLARCSNILNARTSGRIHTLQLLQGILPRRYMDIEISEGGGLTATEIWKPDRWWERTNWEEAAILLADTPDEL